MARRDYVDGSLEAHNEALKVCRRWEATMKNAEKSHDEKGRSRKASHCNSMAWLAAFIAEDIKRARRELWKDDGHKEKLLARFSK